MTLLEVAGVITPICTVLVAWLTLRNTRALKENTDITKEVKEEVKVVKTQTDGMHTELVATKQLLGEAVGKALGKAEQKAETEADNLKVVPPTDVVKVEVVNEPLKVVTPKEPDK